LGQPYVEDQKVARPDAIGATLLIRLLDMEIRIMRLMLSEIRLAVGRALLWVIGPTQNERLNKSLRAVRELRDLFESKPDGVHDSV
jgi:hypothetical protein